MLYFCWIGSCSQVQLSSRAQERVLRPCAHLKLYTSTPSSASGAAGVGGGAGGRAGAAPMEQCVTFEADVPALRHAVEALEDAQRALKTAYARRIQRYVR